MNRLSRIPVWAWFLFSVAYCYALWNPAYSYVQFMQSDIDISIKTIVTVIFLVFGSLYVVEGHRSMHYMGVILFVAIVGSVYWVLLRQGFSINHYYQWWVQLIAGLFLTVALQWGRFYRAITGRVPVASDEDHSGLDHHHG